jgi:Fur family transcriptional regulator, peroxide stress response regulator
MSKPRGGRTSPKTRRSRQRDRILDLLRGTRTHPTANWIYGKLRREFPNLSMGTVYRNLGLLVEQDLVNRIDFGSTFDRYEARTLPHHHFICESCGAVADLEVPIDDSLTKRLAAAAGREVSRHEIRLYGTCDKCAAAVQVLPCN